MAPTTELKITLGADFTVQIDIELLTKIIDATEIREAFDLWRPLQDGFASLDETDPRRPGLQLLSDVMFYSPTPDERHSSYRARSVSGGMRSGEPDDLTDEQLTALSDALATVHNPVVVARLADVLWLRRRDPEHAYTAIVAYLKSATMTESLEQWTTSAQAIQQALALAVMFQKGDPSYLQRVLDHCEAVVRRINGDDPRFLSHRLIDILNSHNHGDLADFSGLASKIAKSAEAGNDFDRARQYWRSVLGIARRTKDESAAQNALKSIVECFVQQGLAGGNVLAKVHFLEKAVTACGDVKEFAARRDEIHALLRGIQKELPDTLTAFELPDDIQQAREESMHDARAKTIERLSGLEPLEALIALSFNLFPPIDYEQLRAQTEELDRNSIAATLAAPAMIDSRGRTIARGVAGGDTGGPAIHSLVRNAKFERDLVCNGAILPALELIECEHHISERFVYEEVVSLSSFVPEQNTAIVAKGIWFGLMRDFVGATTILVPQFEECLRHVLEQLGVRTSTMGHREVEKFRHLPTILQLDETKQTLHSDVIDDLTLILVEPEGPNLRASVAHGFITDAQCHSAEAIYAWWHMLRLTLLPIAVAPPPENEAS